MLLSLLLSLLLLLLLLLLVVVVFAVQAVDLAPVWYVCVRACVLG